MAHLVVEDTSARNQWRVHLHGTTVGAPENAEESLLNLKRQIHARLVEDKKLKALDFLSASENDIRAEIQKSIESIAGSRDMQIPAWVDRRMLVREVLNDAIGLGPLQELVDDPEVNEIMVNGWQKVFVERKGRGLELTTRRFLDDDHLVEVIRRIVAPVGRRINESTPMVDARLKDGSRVNAIIPPLAVSGPALTIRKFPMERLKAGDLVKLGTLTAKSAAFLKLCIEHRANICISGGTGSGKTTLLNVLAAFIPPDERILTIEDVRELKIPHVNSVNLESRPPNIEGNGEIPIRKLVINALRMRPDRIIVGECRGGEAFDMLQAMNTGHEGSLTTIHANSPRDALSRIENMVLMADMNLPCAAIREQMASAINFVVQMARFQDGSRKVTAIAEVAGLCGGESVIHNIFELRHAAKGNGVLGGRNLAATGTVPVFFSKKGLKLVM